MSCKWAKGTGGPAGDEYQNLVWSQSLADPLVTREQRTYTHEGKGSRNVVAYAGCNQAEAPRTDVAKTLDSNGPWGTAAGGTLVVPIDMRNASRRDGRTGAGTPGTGIGRAGDPAQTVTSVPLAVAQGRWVRRLMPIECERLQGFPDGFTDIPGASDAQRYKALGNAVAVPVVEWIGKRLARLGT